MGLHALVVRGGWEGHSPVETTNLVIPFLRDRGFEVRIEDSPEVYADPESMARTDLVLQSVTMSTASDGAIDGLRKAVEAGTGLAGWHGGIADSYRANPEFAQLVGGQFVSHPSKAPESVTGAPGDNDLVHSIDFTALGRSHDILAGLDDFTLETEQYWVLHDDLIDVLATTTHPVQPYFPWNRPIVSPAIWTREWGAGRVFVATPGHDVAVLSHPSVRTIIERGLLWATRTE